MAHGGSRKSGKTPAPQRAMSGGGGSLAITVVDGLGDDADIGNAGLAESVDDGAEGAERNGFIGAKVDDVVLVLG